MYNTIKKISPYIAWGVSLAAMLGSLYFSNILKLPPCLLCWYQRIAMYPLVLLLGIAIVRKDWGIWRYALPLSVVGLLISVYHNLLYYNILPESAAPCTLGVSCTTEQLLWLGFLTIPLMSLISFIIVTSSLLLLKKFDHEQRT